MSLISLTVFTNIHTWHLVFCNTLWLPLFLLAFCVFVNAFWAWLHSVLFIKDVSVSHSLPQLQLFSHFLPPHFWHRGPCCSNEILMKAWGRACAFLSPTAVLWHAKNRNVILTVSGKVLRYYLLKATNVGIRSILCQLHFALWFCHCPTCICMVSSCCLICLKRPESHMPREHYTTLNLLSNLRASANPVTTAFWFLGEAKFQYTIHK